VTASSDRHLSSERRHGMLSWQAGRVVPLFLLVTLAFLLTLYWTLPFLKHQAKAETQTRPSLDKIFHFAKAKLPRRRQ